MKDRKLLVSVLRLRVGGRPIPLYQHAFTRPHQGVLTLRDQVVAFLNRHALVATLLDPATGAAVDGLPPLLDARVIRVTADEWVWTGLEHVLVGMQEVDCAQTWRVRALALEAAVSVP